MIKYGGDVVGDVAFCEYNSTSLPITDLNSPSPITSQLLDISVQCADAPRNCGQDGQPECFKILNVDVAKTFDFVQNDEPLFQHPNFVTIEEGFLGASGKCFYNMRDHMLEGIHQQNWTCTCDSVVPTSAPTPAGSPTTPPAPTPAPTPATSPTTPPTTPSGANCTCQAECTADYDPHVFTFDGEEYTIDGDAGSEITLYEIQGKNVTAVLQENNYIG
eukprot:CAMPEP_0203757290 /NCGR_PEP_ID=MMETSP0098-20131031/10415_1 /ASSEMBLY_ACC=CAM_ASM_000208 /TAXON_ID=96639 /ORGANISM=" , Strain NY0313808BC1" /LENGTH=217 /DNA_ID=CAMNT_0050649485 /DNA_START=1 /DNA_END=650 /DNA_ORIENTATION=+